MAVLAYTSTFCALVWMNNHTCRLLKYISSFHKTQLSLQASLVSIDADMAEILMRRSRQMTFQLYIVVERIWNS